jgi:hypothetical protein
MIAAHRGSGNIEAAIAASQGACPAPTTITSHCSVKAIWFYSRDGRC